MRVRSSLKGSLSVAVGLLSVAAIPRSAGARVTRFVVEERVPYAVGMEWGTAGPYERLKGTAYMEVDPRDPLNAIIVNLDKAPRNARGMVEFSSPFLILKPVDMTRGNRKIWYGINNRGTCLEVAFRAFPLAAFTCNPLTAADVGANNALLQQGYATVDAGWHGDGIQNPNQLFPKFPVATQRDGSPIVGPLRLEYQTGTNTFTQPLVAGWRPYDAADTKTANSTLTVRDRADAPKVTINSDRWAFGKCPTGAASLIPTTTDLCLFDGFAAFKIYELIYPAKNPIVMGLAYAVTRDIGSFLRYRQHDEAGNPNPLVVPGGGGDDQGGFGGSEGDDDRNVTGIRRAYSSGTSSTGMYQREFLYLGFNEDESHRKVFDGVTILSAATHRLFANVQFAHPTFYSGQDQHHDYTSNSIAPFTLAVTTDPVTGRRDGLLKRPATDPPARQCAALLPERLRTYRRGRPARARPASWDLPEQHSGTRGHRGDPEGAGEGDGRVGRSGHRATGQQLSTPREPDARFARRIPRGVPVDPWRGAPERHEHRRRPELRARLWPAGRNRGDAAANPRPALHGAGAQARCGRHRHGRDQDDVVARADGDERRLERARGVPGAGPLQPQRFVHSIRKDEGRAARERRLAQIARGALPQPRRLREGGHEGCE